MLNKYLKSSFVENNLATVWHHPVPSHSPTAQPGLPLALWDWKMTGGLAGDSKFAHKGSGKRLFLIPDQQLKRQDLNRMMCCEIKVRAEGASLLG